jgi:hypothetical protein
MTFRATLFALSMLLLASCHQTITTKPLCEGNEAVIVELEGSYELNMFGETTPIKFKKTNKAGRYSLTVDGEKVTVTTCIVNDNIYFSPDADPNDPDEPFQTFKLEFININKVLLSSVALDEAKLKAKNIPYQRYEDNDGDYMDMVVTEIDNTNISTEDILSAESNNAQTFNAVLIRL